MNTSYTSLVISHSMFLLDSELKMVEKVTLACHLIGIRYIIWFAQNNTKAKVNL